MIYWLLALAYLVTFGAFPVWSIVALPVAGLIYLGWPRRS